MQKKLFSKEYTIKMGDTDASGAIYFNEIFRISCDTFEEMLEQKKLCVKDFLKKGEIAFPIVQSSSWYYAPLELGDCVKIHLLLEKISEKSFCLKTQFFKKESLELASEVKITHVCMLCASRTAIPIPSHVSQVFT